MERKQTILGRIAAGDGKAVAECVQQFGDLVWSLAHRYCYDTSEAEDAVQDIFIDLWSNAGRFDENIASETTFVAMIARRRLIDRVRKRSRQPRLESFEEEAIDADASWSMPLEEQIEAAQVAHVMRKLRPEQKRIMELSLYRGYSHSDIAKKLDLPLGTVKTHLRRGLMSIREHLKLSHELRTPARTAG